MTYVGMPESPVPSEAGDVVAESEVAEAEAEVDAADEECEAAKPPGDHAESPLLVSALVAVLWFNQTCAYGDEVLSQESISALWTLLYVHAA